MIVEIAKAKGPSFDGLDFVVNAFNDAGGIASIEVVKDIKFSGSIEVDKISKETIGRLFKLSQPALYLRLGLLRIQV